MSAFHEERVLSVHHWTERLFSFTTTRDRALRFSNGHFTMIGLPVTGDAKRLMRAYSIASANYEDHLEFLSIKVPGGAFTHGNVGISFALRTALWRDNPFIAGPPLTFRGEDYELIRRMSDQGRRIVLSSHVAYLASPKEQQ